MRIVFMGTPSFSVPILKALIEKYDVVGVVTQPDKLVGRKQIITPSPVKECALKHNLKVFQPEKIRTEYEEIMELNPENHLRLPMKAETRSLNLANTVSIATYEAIRQIEPDLN